MRNVGNSMRQKCQSKLEFGGAKVCKAERIKKYIVSPIIENEVFG